MKITKKITETINRTIGMPGRMISGSKSGYTSVYTDHVPVFNANLVIETAGQFQKIWHGDLDLTLDSTNLVKLSEKLGARLYVLREMDARFESESTPRMEKYVASYSATSMVQIETSTFTAAYCKVVKDDNGFPFVISAKTN